MNRTSMVILVGSIAAVFAPAASDATPRQCRSAGIRTVRLMATPALAAGTAARTFVFGTNRAVDVGSVYCAPGNPILSNFGPAATSGKTMVNDVQQPAVQALVDAGAAMMAAWTAPTVGCARAMRTARKRIVFAIFDDAIGCQHRLDRATRAYGALDPSCSGDPGRAGRKAARQIDRSCGVEAVDACGSRAACVSGLATAEGRSLAQVAFSTLCGNGVGDPGEECDDGNDVSTDGCTTACTLPVCGDGLTQAGEDCDDGNEVPNDGCDNQCRTAVCGDGVKAGSEECDDGNTDPADGCDACKNVVICGASGLVASVSVGASNVAGLRAEITYPSGLGIPGSDFETDSTRVVAVNGAPDPAAVVDHDASGDGVDDLIRLVYAIIGGDALPVESVGPFAEITFDCEPGTPVARSSFVCSVAQASDPSGNARDDVTCKVEQLR